MGALVHASSQFGAPHLPGADGKEVWFGQEKAKKTTAGELGGGGTRPRCSRRSLTTALLSFRRSPWMGYRGTRGGAAAAAMVLCR